MACFRIAGGSIIRGMRIFTVVTIQTWTKSVFTRQGGNTFPCPVKRQNALAARVDSDRSGLNQNLNRTPSHHSASCSPRRGGGKSPVPSKRTRDELIIVGHKEKMVVVSFFIAVSTTDMQGRMPDITLGQLPLEPGRTLHVITWKEDQNNFLDRIRDVFPEISLQLSELNTGEGDIDLCLMGDRRSNSAFMVNVPVHYRPPESG